MLKPIISLVISMIIFHSGVCFASIEEEVKLIQRSAELLRRKAFHATIEVTDEYMQRFPAGAKTSSIYLVKASALIGIKDEQRAAALLQKLVEDYPDSQESIPARQVLKSLGGLKNISPTQANRDTKFVGNARVGGSVVPQKKVAAINGVASSNDPYKMLREGGQAVQARDYVKAKAIFNSIMANSSDPRLVNTAKNQLKMIKRYESKTPTKPRLSPDERTYQAALKHIQKKDYPLAEKTFDNIISRGKDPIVVAKAKAYKKKLPQLISQQWKESAAEDKRYIEYLRDKQKIEEEKAIAEEKRKLAIIEARTKAYPLNTINIPSSQRIAHQGLVLGETSKEDAVEILRRLIDTSRRGNTPEIMEAYSKITGFADVYGLADLSKMKEFNRTLHKNISLFCISYGTPIDCLYFYKNKLIGFKWDLGVYNCGDCVKAKESAMAFNTKVMVDQVLTMLEVNDNYFKRGNDTYIVSQKMTQSTNMTTEKTRTSVFGVKSKVTWGGETTLHASFCIYPTQIEGVVSSLDKKRLFCQ